MNRYETYKEVDTLWLKTLPNHWEVNKVKTCGVAKKELNKNNIEKNVLSLTYGGVIKNNINNPNGLVPASYETYQKFFRNDLVFKLIDLENIKTSRVGIVPEDGIMSSAYIRLKLNDKFIPKYGYYYFYKLYIEEVYNNLGAGVRSTMSSSDLKNMEICIPPLNEQEKIVKYLDWKINEIDKLISIEKNKLNKIRLLKEQHIEDIIFNNGTENSISNWYNYLPRMATEIKIKNIFRLRDERNYLPEEEVELLSLYTKLGVIKNKDIDKRTGNKNTTVHNYKKVYQQDIVVNIMLCWMGAIGISNYNGVTSPAYDVYEPNLKRVNPKYYHYLFRTNKFKSELYKNGKGIVLMKWRVYSDKFKNIIVPLPSLGEQGRIVALIEKFEFNIREYIRSINNAIKDLDLLKQSLISEVVTGQIDVRNVVIPDYEKVDSIADEEIEGEELLEDGD